MFRFLFLVTTIATIAILVAPTPAATGSSSSKIALKLQNILDSGKTANVAVKFTGADTHKIIENVNSVRFASRGAKITAMMTQLDQLRLSSQSGTLEMLDNLEGVVKYTSLWINNGLYITDANKQLVHKLAGLAQVAEIREQIIFERNSISVSDHVGSGTLAEWGIEKIEAPQAWAIPGGNNGAGVVVANIDTGARGTHEAIRNNHRSSYGWYDPYIQSTNPMDEMGTGTHSIGVMVGANGIGVAPGAQWISCRGCESFGCSEEAIYVCGQFIACPFLTDGTAANCSMAPNIVVNGWQTGQDDHQYDQVISAWRAAEIVPTFPTGGNGPACGTVRSPGDNFNVVAVSCTTEADDICGQVARGPAVSGARKPDISAPGVNIRSAWNSDDDAYYALTGSGIAGPFVGGTAALLLSNNPNLTVEQVIGLMENNADRDLGDTAEACGGIPPNEFPNNVYGFGRVNARRALEAAISGKQN